MSFLLGSFQNYIGLCVVLLKLRCTRCFSLNLHSYAWKSVYFSVWLEKLLENYVSHSYALTVLQVTWSAVIVFLFFIFLYEICFSSRKVNGMTVKTIIRIIINSLMFNFCTEFTCEGVQPYIPFLWHNKEDTPAATPKLTMRFPCYESYCIPRTKPINLIVDLFPCPDLT